MKYQVIDIDHPLYGQEMELVGPFYYEDQQIGAILKNKGNPKVNFHFEQITLVKPYKFAFITNERSDKPFNGKTLMHEKSLFRGSELKDVPAKYLLGMYYGATTFAQQRMLDYIEANLESLEQQLIVEETVSEIQFNNALNS